MSEASATERLAVFSPVAGHLVELSDVPDPVFSGSLVGPGAAIDPVRDAAVQALAPVSGRLVKLHPHAFIVQTADGAGVLVHLGIDTVQLEGAGFEVHVNEGDEVAIGAPVVTWDTVAVESGGRSPVVPVVALEAAPDKLTHRCDSGFIDASATLFCWNR